MDTLLSSSKQSAETFGVGCFILHRPLQLKPKPQNCSLLGPCMLGSTPPFFSFSISISRAFSACRSLISLSVKFWLTFAVVLISLARSAACKQSTILCRETMTDVTDLKTRATIERQTCFRIQVLHTVISHYCKIMPVY